MLKTHAKSPKILRSSTFFYTRTKKDSIAPLSPHAPTRPIEPFTPKGFQHGTEFPEIAIASRDLSKQSHPWTHRASPLPPQAPPQQGVIFIRTLVAYPTIMPKHKSLITHRYSFLFPRPMLNDIRDPDCI